jgi:hypothetical protein
MEQPEGVPAEAQFSVITEPSGATHRKWTLSKPLQE